MRKIIAIATIGAALALLHPAFGSTNAIFSQSMNNQSNQFAGATFSPTVAPVVSLNVVGNNIVLSWSQVTVSSGASVSYAVMRSTVGVPAVAVCTGADLPTQTGATVSCTDRTAVTGVAYTYTEQPEVLVSSAATWSLPASVSSASACVKKCK